MAIHFFNESIDFQIQNKNSRKKWLYAIANEEGFKIKDLNYIFCNDEYLHEINLTYLNHDTYTDIITFDNSEKEIEIEGDIFISIQRVEENARKHKTDFQIELSRVICHGLYHLCGFKDKSHKDSLLMKKKENQGIEMSHNYL